VNFPTSTRGLLLALQCAVSVHDYRINAEVRRLLTSRWVDVSRLQIGTTNGVVYLMGHLDSVIGDPESDENGAERALRLAALVDKELRRLPMVRDIVYKLENVRKRAGKWHASSVEPERGHERALGPRLAPVRWTPPRRAGE
jgi:hypothetical protein